MDGGFPDSACTWSLPNRAIWSAARVSSHSTAGRIGASCSSSSTKDSRWWVMHSDRISRPLPSSFPATSRMASAAARHQSVASCSCQPGLGVLRG